MVDPCFESLPVHVLVVEALGNHHLLGELHRAIRHSFHLLESMPFLNVLELEVQLAELSSLRCLGQLVFVQYSKAFGNLQTIKVFLPLQQSLLLHIPESPVFQEEFSCLFLPLLLEEHLDSSAFLSFELISL